MLSFRLNLNFKLLIDIRRRIPIGLTLVYLNEKLRSDLKISLHSMAEITENHWQYCVAKSSKQDAVNSAEYDVRRQ